MFYCIIADHEMPLVKHKDPPIALYNPFLLLLIFYIFKKCQLVSGLVELRSPNFIYSTKSELLVVLP